MGKLLEYIQNTSRGNYSCLATRKLSLDAVEEAASYDDKPTSNANAPRIEVAEKGAKSDDVHRVDSKMVSDSQGDGALFTHFLDGTRHVARVADMGFGSNIYPLVCGQIIVGCCERIDRSHFRTVAMERRLVLAFPDNYNTEGRKGEDKFCRQKLAEINEQLSTGEERSADMARRLGLRFDEVLLYAPENSEGGRPRRGGALEAAVAAVQDRMTTLEQLLVARLCRDKQLNEHHWLIKDGTLNYNPRRTAPVTGFNDVSADISQVRQWQHVVGVSKLFNPGLLRDRQQRTLARHIAQLSPSARTVAYRYGQGYDSAREYAVWYLRLRRQALNDDPYAGVVKCEWLLPQKGATVSSDQVDALSAALLAEAWPVAYGCDARWANHLYPVYTTENRVKSHYWPDQAILALF